jgi:hypothetical protein
MPQELGYFEDSARPLTSFVYVIPVLVAYEAGVCCLGPTAMRNGADVWLRHLLDQTGFGQYFLLPVLTCGLLLAWHHVQRERWQVSSDTLLKMATETTAFALALVGFGFLYMRIMHQLQPAAAFAPASPVTGGGLSQSVGYLGAGVYEEVLFRLLVIPTVARGLQTVGESKAISLVGGATISSLLFAAAHYQIFTGVGEPFDVTSFLFRFFAGIVFASIFIFRGFGIAAGSHTLYDLIVGAISA